MIPEPFEITAVDGAMVATNGAATIKVDTVEGSRLFRRRAVRAGQAGQRAIEWVVAELDGVRVYFDGTNAVVTREDLMP